MSTNGDRRSLLEELGRFYGEQRFALIFTGTNRADNPRRDPKKVTTPGWQHTRPLEHAAAGAAFLTSRGLHTNPAITARTSNLVLIDCDTPEGLAEIEALGLPPTLTARSSEEYKRHFYFRPPSELDRVEKVGFRFEPAGLSADENRYLVCPPALHPSGVMYAFLAGLGPGEVEIAELPLDVYRALVERAGAAARAEGEAVRRDPSAKFRQGSRGRAIFRYACQQRRWTADRDEILELALRYNARHCEPPISRERVELQVDGAMKKDGEQELPIPEPESVSESVGETPSPPAREGSRDATDSRFPPVVENGRESVAVAAPSANSVELVFQSAPEFAAEDEPNAEMILGYDDDDAAFVAGGTVVEFGKGGGGKTVLITDIVCHLATGTDWQGLKVPKARKVAVVENDGPRGRFCRKVQSSPHGRVRIPATT
jgi:hypothetical protein